MIRFFWLVLALSGCTVRVIGNDRCELSRAVSDSVRQVQRDVDDKYYTGECLRNGYWLADTPHDSTLINRNCAFMTRDGGL